MKHVINLQGCAWTEEYARKYYGSRFDSMIENNLLAYIDEAAYRKLLGFDD